MNNYYKFPATKIGVIENMLNKSLPNSLNQEIAWQCFSRAILRIPYFSGWPREILEKMVCLVEELIFLENDVVAEAGMEYQDLMIVDAGLLAVYVHKEHHFDAIPYYKEIEHLNDGDYFGQVSLVTESEVSSSTVVAITTCKMLFVEKTLFRQLMRNNPNLFYSLQEELKNDSTKHHDKTKMNLSLLFLKIKTIINE